MQIQQTNDNTEEKIQKGVLVGARENRQSAEKWVCLISIH